MSSFDLLMACMCSFLILFFIAISVLAVIWILRREEGKTKRIEGASGILGSVQFPGASEVSTREPAAGAPLSSTLIGVAQNLLAIAGSDLRPLTSGILRRHEAKLKAYVQRDASESLSDSTLESRRAHHVQTVRYLSEQVVLLVTSTQSGQASGLVDIAQNVDKYLPTTFDEHIAFHHELSQQGIPFPLQKTSVSPPKYTPHYSYSDDKHEPTIPSDASTLVDSLLTVQPSELPQVQAQLVSIGPAAFVALQQRKETLAESHTSTLETDAVDQQLGRLQDAIAQVDRNVSTFQLIEMFCAGVVVAGEEMRNDLRPNDSVIAEQMLRYRGEAVVPNIGGALTSSETKPAARYFAIRLLKEIGGPEAEAVLLKRVYSDKDPACRLAALKTFHGNSNPSAMHSLVRSMRMEIVISYDQHNQLRVAGTTKSVLTLFGGGSISGSLLGAGAGWLAAPMKSDLSRMKPLDRLDVFTETYFNVIANSPAFPAGDILALATDSNSNVRRIIHSQWMDRLLNSEDPAVKSRTQDVLQAATSDPDTTVRNLAQAKLSIPPDTQGTGL